jgi:hypothetical protein
MEAWMVLEFAFALATTIGCFALIISELHIIERAEEQEWLNELREKILRIPS